MKTKRIVLLLLIIAAAAGLGRSFVHIQNSYELSSAIFGDRRTFNAFHSASTCTAERLHTNMEYGSANLADYSRDSPVALTSAQIRQLQELFSRHDSYSPEVWLIPTGQLITTTCGAPSFGVLLTFRSEPLVRIALCFRCHQFGVFVGHDDRMPYVNRSDPMDFMHAPLVDLVKALYPRDPEIQRLRRE